MAVPLRLNFKDIADLNADLKQSPRAAMAIVQRVLSLALRRVRREQAPQVPGGITGGLRRSLGVSVRRSRNNAIIATYGFFRGRRVSARTAVASNVLQKPGAQARKSAYLWIPTSANQNITPRDFFASENTFIKTVGANRVAFVRNGDDAVPLFILKRNTKLSAPPLPIDQRVTAELPVITKDIQDSIAQVIEARKAALQAIADG
jgi:hypothetical protein